MSVYLYTFFTAYKQKIIFGIFHLKKKNYFSSPIKPPIAFLGHFYTNILFYKFYTILGRPLPTITCCWPACSPTLPTWTGSLPVKSGKAREE